MNIIAVDDEASALKTLERAINKVVPDAYLTTFSAVGEALDYAKKSPVDVAFLDIEMREMNGLFAAKRLKDINPTTNIIFVTGHSSYVMNAFEMHASGYVMKPIRAERVAEELENLRHPISSADKGVRVQCFGNFGVFIDGVPLLFSRTKAKEFLAYLVHKQGTPVTNAEIAAVLWEGEPDTLSVRSNTRNVIARLIKILRDAGIEDIVSRTRNSTAINVDKISCDYYDYLRGKPESVNAYAGEYMNEYSWAEFTVAYLNDKL